VENVADGATITIDAALASTFRVTLGGNHEITVINPAYDGQKIVVEVTQGEGGPWSLTYSSALDFGAAGQPALSTTAGDEDDFGLSYKAATGRWRVLAFAPGYAN